MITPSFSLTATERVLPKLTLDFTTAVLDPRITFTRSGATATRTNSSGFIEDVAADIARFDFNSLTLVCKGLLIEEQRSNFALQSENFGSVTWIKSSVTAATSSSVSPRNTLTAYTMTEDTSTNIHHLAQTVTTSLNAAYTMSAYVKNIDRRYVILSLYAVTSASLYAAASFDLQTGLLVNTGAAGAGFSVTGTRITREKNDWYRIEVSVTNGSASPAIRFSIGGSTNGTIGAYGLQNYAGTSKSLDVFGAQIEAGNSATSYIPTVASQVTRTADIATMTGTNFSDWYVAGAASFVIRALPSTVSGTRPALQFDDATTNEVIALRGNTTNPELYIVDGGTPQAQIDAGTIAANTAYTFGAAWNTDNCAAAVNGGAAVTDTTATIPAVTQARLGSDGTNYLNGLLQTMRYWPQRIINAEVQAFSKG